MLNFDKFILGECHIVPGLIGFHDNVAGWVVFDLSNLSFPVGNFIAAGPTLSIQDFHPIANYEFSHFGLLY